MDAGAGREWLPRHRVAAALNPHLLSLLKIEPQHEIARLPATRLLTPARLDVMAKYIYATQRLAGAGTAWGDHVYREHLRIWNEFREDDGSGKSAFAEYRESFDRLLRSFADGGFDERRGLLPVGSGDVIIDGSHRLAAALALDRELKIACFDFRPPRYDHEYFTVRGLGEDVLDDMVLQYCRLDTRVRVAVLFPVARGLDDEILEILRACGPVVARKFVTVGHPGRANLVRLLYRGEPWLGDGIKPTPELLYHVNNRFVDGEPVKFVFFAGEDARTRIEVKNRIRALFSLGNDSAHINDTHEQTVSIAEAVLNANGVHHLNNARPAAFRNFTALFETFKRWIERERLDRRRFCIDASAVLAVYGLRDANDLDYLYAGDCAPPAPDNAISCHNAEIRHYGAGLDDLVMNPHDHFYIDGVKFAALHRVREMKARRAEPKDRGDLYRIDAMGSPAGLASRALRWYYTLPGQFQNARYQAVRTVARLIPEPLLPLARAVYRLPEMLRERVGPRDRNAIYRGFELHYSRGTSLVERIRDGRIYEPDVSDRLVQALKSRESVLCLDIGANIGLVTLNVLAAVPGAKVVAFEPGPHQAELMERTLKANRLEGRVTLVRSALGHRSGTALFSVHGSRDASGDGFLDTGRAGRAETTEVAVTTLDEWWHGAGRPRVDAIKIDTEGAELWVLRGGEALLRHCRPLVIFELHPDNIRVYPYSAGDILQFFLECGYRVTTITGAEIAPGNLESHLGSTHDFVAESCNG